MEESAPEETLSLVVLKLLQSMFIFLTLWLCNMSEEH